MLGRLMFTHWKRFTISFIVCVLTIWVWYQFPRSMAVVTTLGIVYTKYKHHTTIVTQPVQPFRRIIGSEFVRKQ